jgi:uncharacterized protein YbjT (DUF2867 family)
MILVTGASGLVGGEVVRQLSGQQVPVRALVRDPSRAPQIASLPGVQVVTGDLGRPETLGPALADVGQAVLISSADASMADVQSSFIDTAAKAGIPSPSSPPATPRHSWASSRTRPLTRTRAGAE